MEKKDQSKGKVADILRDLKNRKSIKGSKTCLSKDDYDIIIDDEEEIIIDDDAGVGNISSCADFQEGGPGNVSACDDEVCVAHDM